MPFALLGAPTRQAAIDDVPADETDMHAIIERVPYAERVVTEPVVHPLLEDLESIGAGAHLFGRLSCVSVLQHLCFGKDDAFA